MGNINKFRLIRIVNPPDFLSETGCEYICVDPDGIPFKIINQFMQYLLMDVFRSKTTVIKYIQFVMVFFNYLYWNYKAEDYLLPRDQLRLTIVKFIQENLGWQTTKHGHENYQIKTAVPPQYRKCSKAISRNSLKVILSSLNTFYEFLVTKSIYTFNNPFTFQIYADRKEFIPTPPPISGVTRRDNRIKKPYLYYCLVKNEWKPQFIDNPRLNRMLIPNFTELGDRIITRILFFSGARIDEVLDLTKKDWVSLFGKQNGAWARNKGEGENRVKIIGWDSETDRMLRNYVSHERRDYDQSHRTWNLVGDNEPIFLNRWGNQKNYWNYYPKFKNVCEKLKIKMTPHQIRHWVVTMAVQIFNMASSVEEKTVLREDFIAKMHWSNPETIKVYDNHIQLMSVDVFQIIAKGIKNLVKERELNPAFIEVFSPEVQKKMGIVEELEALINDD